jgi:hypothetical protein
LWIIPVNIHPIILPPMLKFIPLIIVLLGRLVAWFIITYHVLFKPFIIIIPLTHYASCLIWFLVPLSSQFTIKTPIFISHNYLKSLDQSWLEVVGGQGLWQASNLSSNSIMLIFNTKPVNYLIISTILASVAIFILYLDSLIIKHIPEDDKMEYL